MSMIDPRDVMDLPEEDVPVDEDDQMTAEPAAPRDELLDGLIENALDFLQRSIAEFKENPKYSVIHFAAAVELFLKSRLMAEHWTLVVDRKQIPNRKRFESGDFKSIAPEQAISLIEQVLGCKLVKGTSSAFAALRKHRNKLIHFHANLEGDGVLQDIVREQCLAWYHLKELLLDEWRPVFIPYQMALSGVDGKMKRHGEYLEEVFKKRAPEIDILRKRDHSILECPVCHYEALTLPRVVGLSEEVCLVCDHSPTVVVIPCPECEKAVCFVGCSDSFECPHCEEIEIDKQSIIDQLDTSDYYDSSSIHCLYCCEENTVITVEEVEKPDTYLCVECFAVSQQLGQCGWCSDVFIDFDDSMSWWKGCEHCDGQWDKD